MEGGRSHVYPRVGVGGSEAAGQFRELNYPEALSLTVGKQMVADT